MSLVCYFVNRRWVLVQNPNPLVPDILDHDKFVLLSKPLRLKKTRETPLLRAIALIKTEVLSCLVFTATN